MSANDLLTLVTRIVFTLLGVVTVIDFLRRRDPARRDIALMFSSLAASIVIQLITSMLGVQADWLNMLGALALIAQPYLMLRLVQYFRSVSTAVQRAALLAMVLSWAALIFFSPALPSAATLAIIAYFVVVDGYAVTAFVRGALTTSGVVRQRLRLAAAGSGLLALTLLIAGMGVLFPTVGPSIALVTQALAIVCALTFYLGFAPPRWLRSAWQMTELRRYLLQNSGAAAAERAGMAESLDQLCRSSRQGVGGMAAAVIQRDESEGKWELRAETDQIVLSSAILSDQRVGERAWRERRPTVIHVSHATSGDRRLLEAAGADTVLVVPIVTRDPMAGLLLVFQRRHSLFVDDDLSLLELLAQHGAVILDNYRLIDELRSNSAKLAQANALLIQEIAERRRGEERLAEERNLLRTFVDNIPDFAYVKDTESRFLLNNLAHTRLLGAAAPEELAGKRDFDFFEHELAAQYYADEQAVIRSGQPLVQREELTTHRDGSQIWVSTTKVPLRDSQGEIVGIVGVARDITERKQTEDEIRQLNESLKQHALELEAANKELEAFSYSVSHDLRAPLRAIDGFSRILLEDHASQLTPDVQRYLTIVREDSQQMGRLIDDLLTFSRLNRQQLKKQTVNPVDIVNLTLADLREEQQDRQVEVIIGDLPACQADPALLKQVYINLLSNALKYTRRRERAVIEIGSHRQDGEVTYYVRDNGVGFNMQYAHKLFGVFQRLHSMEEYEGTGVGLAIIQRIVHRHGGRVWAEAEPDKGAAFYFTLDGGTDNG